MSDRSYMSTPIYIVEFPDIDPPKSHKVKGFDDFMPVQMFSKAGRRRKSGGAYTDANSCLYECAPIQIVADEVICTLLNSITGSGIIHKEMKLVELGRDKKGATERYEATLEGLEIESQGNAVVTVTYQWYKSKLFRQGDSTMMEEYDFKENEPRD
jgi:hypothetical protein